MADRIKATVDGATALLDQLAAGSVGNSTDKAAANGREALEQFERSLRILDWSIKSQADQAKRKAERAEIDRQSAAEQAAFLERQQHLETLAAEAQREERIKAAKDFVKKTAQKATP